VLRSPNDRAAYDRQLAGGTGPGSGGSSGSGGPARPTPAATGRPVPSFGDHLVDPRIDPAADGRGGHRWGPIVAILVVAALVVIVTAYAAHGHPGSAGSGTTVGGSADGYQVGSCVAVIDQQADVVPCDQPNNGRVAATTDYPRPCPSGTETVSLIQLDLSLCLKPSS
jgi:hypothetical protein